MRSPVLLFVIAGLCAESALADGHRGHRMPANAPPAYAQECASCHVAYPPGMLPAQSWARIMKGLDHHYGTDASLDPAAVHQLSVWLQANAGDCRRATGTPPQDRITRSTWFERKHRRIDPAVWKLSSVKSAANCAACHRAADRGVYNERNLRVPAGLTPAQLRAFYDD